MSVPQFDQARAMSLINKKDLTNLIWTDKSTKEKVFNYWETLQKNDLFMSNKTEELSTWEMADHNIRYTQKWRKHIPRPDFANNEIIHEHGHLIGYVGLLMGLPCIELMSSEEQFSKWHEPTLKGDYILCYAQTELAHGSDIQSIKTTATYDPNTEKFVINTPSLEAYKYWPGDLGYAANFAIVYAQLFTNGKNYGVFPLMVQIRDLKTHKPLPGISIGDMGPKLGHTWKDNGWLAFDNISVDRNALFGRYVSVEPNGKFKTKGNMKIMYASMMYVRESILAGSAKGLACGTLVALRYSHIRTQF